MLRKIFAALGATMLVMGSIGGASAASVPITEGVASIDLDPGKIYIATSESGAIDPAATPNTFSHTYTFDLAANADFSMANRVSSQNDPSDGLFGIMDLTYTWSGSAVVGGPQTVTITDSLGAHCAGSNCGGFDTGGFPYDFAVSFFDGSGFASIVTVVVTGTAEASGGQYSLIISPIPLPAAALLFGSALLGGGLMRRRKMIKEFGLPA